MPIYCKCVLVELRYQGCGFSLMQFSLEVAGFFQGSDGNRKLLKNWQQKSWWLTKWQLKIGKSHKNGS